MLCEKCTNIHFKPIEDCLEIELYRRFSLETEEPRFEDVFYVHHNSKDALKSSADLGCHLCTMIWFNLFGPQVSEYHTAPFDFARGEIFLHREGFKKGEIVDESKLENWNRCGWTWIQWENRREILSSRGGLPDLMCSMLDALTFCTNNDRSYVVNSSAQAAPVTASKTHLKGVLRDCGPAQDPALYFPQQDCSTISLSNIALASLWLDNCRKNHQPCREFQAKGDLPTRVIDISDPENPCLTKSLRTKGEYVTLSYKWGEGRRYVTTTRNVEEHLTSIPLASLPKTFKDAIYVSHKLGFRWLWIDALCILQDSSEDQTHEIERMDSVFRNSTLTLFATAADNADAGLSVTRDPRWMKPCHLTTKTSLNNMTVQGSAYYSFDEWKARPSSLFTRGWVLQEEIMAARGLHFSSDQLSWRCLCGESSERRPGPAKRTDTVKELGQTSGSRTSYTSGSDGFDLFRLWIQHQDPVPDRPRWQRNNQFDHWYSMIERYNSRALSHVSDVLPALAGLARAFSSTHGCTYMAGLWKEDLQLGLCWYVARPSGGEALEESSTFRTPVIPRLPSWSWVSNFGTTISFRGWENNHYHIKEAGVVVDKKIHCSQSSAAQFSAVREYYLTLTGRLKVAHVAEKATHAKIRKQGKSSNVIEGARWLFTVLDAFSGEDIGFIALDSDFQDTGKPVRTIYCLLCLVREKYDKWQLTCLGLVPLNDSHEEFERVGLVFLQNPWWYGQREIDGRDAHSLSKDTKFTRTVRIR